MSIRFPCPSCAQPIETDDQWASKLVACPFCRNMVNAPAESTLAVEQPPPVADALPVPDVPRVPEVPEVPVGPVGQRFASVDPPAPPAQATTANTLAMVSFGLSLLAVVLLYVGTNVYITNIIAIVGDKLLPSDGDFMANQQRVMEIMEEYMNSQNGTPWWAIVVPTCMIIGGASWLGGIVCGCIAVRHHQRRRYAIAALVMSALCPIMVCCSGMAAMSAGMEAGGTTTAAVRT